MKILFAGDLSFSWMARPGLISRLRKVLSRSGQRYHEIMHRLDEQCGLSGINALLNGAEVRLQAERIAAGLREVRSRNDFFCVNLECALSGRGDPIEDKKFKLKALPHHFFSLKELGANIACLANNHILDYGPASLTDTVAILEQTGIHHAGLRYGKDSFPQPLMIEKSGEKLGILNFVAPEIIDPDPEVFFRHDPSPFPLIPELVFEAVEKYSADMPIVAVLHWGEEWSFLQSEEMKAIARQAIDRGASAVIGHHSHLAGAIEEYRGRPIAYGLGNLFMSLPAFSQRRAFRRLMARLTIENNQLVEYEFLPLISDADNCPIVSPAFNVESLYDEFLPPDTAAKAPFLYDSFSELRKADLSGEFSGERKEAVWDNSYRNPFKIIQGKLPLGPGFRFNEEQWNGVAQSRDLMGANYLLTNITHFEDEGEMRLKLAIPGEATAIDFITGFPQWFRPREEFIIPGFTIALNERTIFKFDANLPGPDWRIDNISAGDKSETPKEIVVNFTGTAGKLGYLAWRLLAF